MAAVLDSIPDDAFESLVLSSVIERNRKVAMVAAMVSHALEDRGLLIDGGQFARRFDACLAGLVQKRQLEAFGSISNWRYSEVRLAGGTASELVDK